MTEAKHTPTCICDHCANHVFIDVSVPDDLWATISPSPVDGFKGGGVLCPQCIVTKLCAELASLRSKLAEAENDTNAAHEALAGVILAYDRDNPMRTADCHPQLCCCLRCEVDTARAALSSIRGDA